MSRYTLEVIAPFVKDLPDDDDELVSALNAIATVHGGMVVEPAKASANAYQRQYVTLSECEFSLEQGVEWLRKKFLRTRFTLKEFTST